MCMRSIIILHAIGRSSLVSTSEENKKQAIAMLQQCFTNLYISIKKWDKIQLIAVIIKLHAFAWGFIQRETMVETWKQYIYYNQL